MENIVTLKEIEAAANNIAEQIKKTGIEIDTILCITKGWMFLSYYLSKILNIPRIETLNVKSYEGQEGGNIVDFSLPKTFWESKILIVDDLVDTGHTIEYIVEKYFFISPWLAVQFWKEWSKVKPDFYDKKVWEEWIKFIYE